MTRFLKIFIVFIAFILLDLFLVRDFSWVNSFFTGKRFYVNYLLTLIFFFVSLTWFCGLSKKNLLVRIIIIILIVLPSLLQTSYFDTYRQFISEFGFLFFVENPIYSLQLWQENLPIVTLKLIVITVFSILLLLVLFRQKSFSKIWHFITVPTVLIIFFATSFSWYGNFSFQYNAVSFYGSLLSSLRTYKIQKTDAIKINIAKKKLPKKAPNIIWIIGESLNISRMSLYGYGRNTTKNLDNLYKQDKLVRFDNVASIGNQTRTSFPYLLKGLQGVDPNGIFYSYPSVINYLKASDYYTAVISAQDWRWGSFDSLFVDDDLDFYKNGNNFSSIITVSKGADDLLVLKKGITPFIKNNNKPFFLLIHMDGSHYPYNKHSPKKYKKFLPEKKANGNNAYDNTVVYSDIFFDRLVKLIHKNKPNTWIFFTSDHGQNLNGSVKFNNEYDYSKQIIHMPLFIIPPINISTTLLNSLKKNVKAPISQADILATTLDIINMPSVKPLDGFSLLGDIPIDRIRIVSSYMSTFYSAPVAALVLPNFSYYFINFKNKIVLLPDGKTTLSYKDFYYKDFFSKRIEK